MIKRLTGKVDGNDVVFTLDERGRWECIVPATKSGRYTLELYAEDGAGNSSYYATVLFIIDLTTMTVTVTMLEYNTELTDFKRLTEVSEKFEITLVNAGIDISLLPSEIDAYLLDMDYPLKLISNIRC